MNERVLGIQQMAEGAPSPCDQSHLEKSVAEKREHATGESTWIGRQRVPGFLGRKLVEVRRALVVRQPAFNDPRRDLRPRGKAQFSEDIVHMPLDRALAEDQETRNLAAGFALSNERGDFVFTSR